MDSKNNFAQLVKKVSRGLFTLVLLGLLALGGVQTTQPQTNHQAITPVIVADGNGPGSGMGTPPPCIPDPTHACQEDGGGGSGGIHQPGGG